MAVLLVGRDGTRGLSCSVCLLLSGVVFRNRSLVRTGIPVDDSQPRTRVIQRCGKCLLIVLQLTITKVSGPVVFSRNIISGVI